MSLFEIRDRKQFIEKYEAREYLHQMRIVNAGFNGGDGAIALQKELHSKAYPPMITLLDKQRKKTNWIQRMLERAVKSDD
jgi:hypothetical protein